MEEHFLKDKIINYLKQKDDWCSVKEIAEKMKKNRAYISGYLEALANLKIIKNKILGPAKLFRV